MINSIIEFSLKQRLIVILLSLALFGAGIYSFYKIPIDAFPDISSTQVKIIMKAPGMTPEEVENRVVKPLEAELLGLENQKLLKSTSKYAIADITIDFNDGTDIYRARAQVSEKLASLLPTLPSGVEGGMAPITTPLGEAFMFTIEGNLSQKEKRELLDFVIRPVLRGAKGVADVNALGGEARAIVVQPDYTAMRDLGIPLSVLKETLENNLKNDGAGRVDANEESYLVKVQSGVKDAGEIANITIHSHNGPIRIGDFCEVRDDARTRLGYVTKDGIGEATEGLILTLKGANAQETIAQIKERLEQLKPQLPTGVTIVPFYDRSDLIEKAVGTVSKALVEAIVLVIVLLMLFLGDVRAAIAVSVILPFSIAIAFLLMKYFGLSANLMSLGGLAIAIGMLVDSAVVVVENSFAKLSENNTSLPKLHQVYRATQEVSTAVFSGILIIAVVFLPLLTLEGLEGKLFAPVAMTIVFALFGSLLLSLTLIPVVSSLVLKSTPHKETFIGNFFARLYEPMLSFALNRTKLLFSGAIAFLIVSFTLFAFVGKSFMPTLDEGDIILGVETPPSISLEKSKELNLAIQRTLIANVPEIKTIVARTGSDELGLDPMGLNQTDTFITLKAQTEWQAKNKEEIKAKIQESLKNFPGISFSFTQPIEMRISEMLTGSRGDLAIKIYGNDIDTLNTLSQKIADTLDEVKGSSEVFTTLNEGVNYLSVKPNRTESAKTGVDTAELELFLKTALEGVTIDELSVENTRIPVLMRLDGEVSQDMELFKSLELPLSDGFSVPISSVAQIETSEGALKVDRENAKRYSTVRANVEGRDLVGYVEEVKQKIDANVKLPNGYTIVYGGQFENQQRAAAKLMTVIPISIGVIFLILFFTFRSVSSTTLILLNIPFAVTGGIISLYFSGEYLSVPASVGFIALFGIAVLNGVVMVSYFNTLLGSGYSIDDAVAEGARRRLRPVLMTAFIAALGLLPLLFATGVGSEIQKPLAIVVLGGLVTSTILTLLILPPAFKMIYKRGK
ncbi:MAG: CusA/CzcA family heavy metal efflux RND transporter [Sulfuricurvum sp. PD_MW2]|uniref:efflux RND transporter permease subunit n=1 Tax=Sulfuricurvum sp. PD_MW2 TaxID=2027917 RepID=UPI000C063BCF|nr:efflux RND transporter permease subunit [Sulfuricurvum sp. PD_MW2]PHM16858.1 MAG: CusA/CzcA family heavy metal efflux RND transporter [Sulfuricurvum sp. PD_MW2]